MKYSTITKSQLSEKLQISACSLRYYLNFLWFERLEKAGYNRNQKILTPKQLLIIKDEFGDWE